MRKILTVIFALFVSFLLIPAPVYAAGSQGNCPSGSVEIETNIINNGHLCEDGSGSSIITILKLVANILSVGVGFLGILGITIVGIQYLTAGGNEEKTRKAKKRILEIVIGLAVYAAAYAILRWLLPNFTGI